VDAYRLGHLITPYPAQARLARHPNAVAPTLKSDFLRGYDKSDPERTVIGLGVDPGANIPLESESS